MQFKYIAQKEQRLVKRIERSREICFRVLLCVWTNVIWRLMEQTTTQSFLKRIHFFKRTRFYVWKDVHLFMNIIVIDKKLKFKQIVFLSCFMYCWFKKKQKIPQRTYKIISTLSPRKLSESILQNLLWLFRWLYRVSQKKVCFKVFRLWTLSNILDILDSSWKFWIKYTDF